MNENNSQIAEQARALLGATKDFTANMANLSALIYQNTADINWAGFYIFKNGKLVLGPFQGKPACVEIENGKGVCGLCAKSAKTVIVPDVHKFPGHIACDCASKSEIVIPLFKTDGTIYGVMDIDSPKEDRFSQQERELFESLADILTRACGGFN